MNKFELNQFKKVLIAQREFISLLERSVGQLSIRFDKSSTHADEIAKVN